MGREPPYVHQKNPLPRGGASPRPASWHATHVRRRRSPARAAAARSLLGRPRVLGPVDRAAPLGAEPVERPGQMHHARGRTRSARRPSNHPSLTSSAAAGPRGPSSARPTWPARRSAAFRSARGNTSVSRPQPLAPSRGRGAGSTHQWRKASEAMCALISGMASNFSTYDLRFGYSSRMVGSKQMSASRVCHACGTRGGQRELRRAGGPRGGPRLRARRTWKSAIVMSGPAAYSAVKNLSSRFSLAGTVSRKPFLSSGPNSGL